MRKLVSILAWLMIFPGALLACVPNLAQGTPMPEKDFGFRFEFGSCFTDVLDTFDGTYTKDLIFDPAVTIPFRLSDEQMMAVYGKMIEIDFFGYPDVFAIPTPRSGLLGIQTPAERYHMVVRNGGMSKALDWIDEIREPLSREAENLSSLFDLITEMISVSPEYRQLPERNGGCA